MDNKDIKKLEGILKTIREAIQMDGGDLELVSFADGVISLRFQGACVGCPLSIVTYSEYIEKEIKMKIPSVKTIKMVE